MRVLASERSLGSALTRPAEDDRRADLVRRILLGEISAEQACREEQVDSAELTEWLRQYRRAVRRAVDEQFAAALSQQGIDVDDFVLSGNLETMAVADLLEAVQQGLKDAHIRVEHAGAYGHIWCVEGEVIDAEAGSLSGAHAVYHLLSLGEGRVRADFSKVARERTLVCSIPTLILEAGRRSDEIKSLRAELGPGAAVYEQNPALLARADELRADVAQLWPFFDGTRSLAEALHLGSLSELEALRAMERLLREGWLILKREPDVDPAPDVVREAAVEPPPVSEMQPVPVPVAADPGRASRLSFDPVAASLRVVASLGPVTPRSWYVAALLAGVAIPAAFMLGFHSAPEPAAVLAGAVQPLGAGQTLGTALCGSAMALIPAGVGPAPGGAKASLRPFCLGQREVSVAQYEACVGAGRCEAAQTESSAAVASGETPASQCNTGLTGRGSAPVNCVTARQAEQYCEWRHARLPLDAEWEFAARPLASSDASLSALSVREPLRDIVGGVSEWTRGERLVPSEAGSEPQARYVVMDGAASGPPNAEAPPSRLYMNANAQGRTVGFRCASSLSAPTALP